MPDDPTMPDDDEDPDEIRRCWRAGQGGVTTGSRPPTEQQLWVIDDAVRRLDADG